MTLQSEHRLGTFRISHKFMEDEHQEAALLAVFGCCIVVRAEYLYGSREIEYTAFSSHFRTVGKNERAPEYLVCMTRLEDGAVSLSFQEVTRAPWLPAVLGTQAQADS